MNRLQHSFPGYRRRMQMSRTALFIFIEGYKDRYVYSRIADLECQGRGVSYEVLPIEEVVRGSGGKNTLLKFLDYLKRKFSLIDRFKNKTTLAIFLLDKDVDDFLRTKRRSDHVVYTETYEFENYLFMHGDLAGAAAASASLDIRLMQAGLGSYPVWRERAATHWKEWVKICLYSRTRIRSVSNYSQRRSPINRGVSGPLNMSEHTRYLTTIQTQSGLPAHQFDRSFDRLSRKVEGIYSSGQHDLIFKGKWYVCFLVADIQRIAGSRRFNYRHLEGKLLSNLAQTLNFNDSWVDHFRLPIRRLFAQAGI